MRRNLFSTGLLLLLLFRLIAAVTAAQPQPTDLYALLGVTRTATAKEIKKQYRRMALETHPDKRKDVSAEQAAEDFRQVVLAFEVLSDPERREYYDATGRTEEEEQADFGGEHWHFHWHYHHYQQQQQQHLRDTWEAQQAQSRLMHISSWEQFRTVMTNDDDVTLERHFVLCLVKPGPMETTALKDMVFPYPFAGMSEQEIWWENLLQTMVHRVTAQSDALAAFFGIDEDESWTEPLFIYGKAGAVLQNETDFPRIQTTNRDEMENFVWEHLQVDIEFVNGHSHPVELFWMNEEPVLMAEILSPGESVTFVSSLSQVWFARDKRVDNFKHPQERLFSFSDESVLMAFHVLEDSPVFQIPERSCFDLATDCLDWAQYGECMRQPARMEQLCAYTCDFCEEEEIVYHLYQGHDEL